MADLFGIGKLSGETKEFVEMFYPDLLQPPFKKVGYALSDLIGFLTIPTTYLGYQTKKTNIYFDKNLEKYKNKLNFHDQDKIGKVSPEIGVPILEKLSIVTSEELADMYTSLLVNASLIKKSKYAHPSFINVLQNISVDEAKIIQYLTEDNDPLLFITYLKMDKNDSDSTIEKMDDFYLNLTENIQLNYPEMASFYFLNLEKLGIIGGMPGFPNIVQSLVSELSTEIHEESTKREVEANISNDKVEYEISDINGYYILTKYGEEFIKCIKK